MPRPATATAPPPKRTAITASARRIEGVAKRRAITRQDASWQEQAWKFFDLVGEFEYVANWIGNVQSRAKLEVRLRGELVTKGPARDAMDEFFGSESGRSECLKADGVHKTVAGEHFIVSWEEGGKRYWEVVDGAEVSEVGKRWKIGEKTLPENALVIHTFRRHPRRRDRVHAPSIAALPILSEIDGFTRHVAAQIDSRLTNAGLLLMPNEVTFTAASSRKETLDGEETVTAVTTSSNEELVETLIETASTAIQNPDSAAATIPIILTADGDHLDKVKLLTFWSELDAVANSSRDSAIRRLALSLDVPPEALLGSGDANSWTMFTVDESSIKSHIEPNLNSFCHDITVGYLIPAITGVVPDADLPFYEVTVDTTEMRLRPNRSKEAAELYDRGLLSAEALRRETGFHQSDAPEEKEVVEWVQRQAAKGSATPSMMAQAYRGLGWKDFQDPVEEEPRGQMPDPNKDGTRPELTDPEDLEKDRRRKAEAALLGAAEMVVFRALERFGNKAKSRLRFDPEGAEPSEFYLLRQFTTEQQGDFLDGSFEVCDRLAETYSVDKKALRSIIETYTASLVAGRKPYQRDALASALEKVHG